MEISMMVAMVMGLAELVKQLGWLPSKYIPLLNLAAGIIISIFYSGQDVKASIFEGMVIGLAASGCYSGAKNIIQGVNYNRKK